MSDSPAKSLAASFALFWDILRLRRGPEDLPASWSLLVVVIAMQPVLAMAMGAILPPLPVKPGEEDHSMALLALDVVIPLLWGWLILQLARRPERFLQMMTAAFGCQLMLYPLIVPVYWASSYFDKASAWAGSAEMLLFGLTVWITVVTARIVRSATDWPMFSCIGLVVVQAIATSLAIYAMFPEMLEQLKQGV